MGQETHTGPAAATYPDLVGKVAVVTGGSRGIGEAIARRLAENGARVAVNGRDRTAIDAVVGGIERSGGTAVGLPADVRDLAALEEARDAIERDLGGIDLLAAVAGGGGNPIPALEMSPDLWRATIEENLTSTFLTVRAFVPGMAERGRGSVVTISSSAGRMASGASAAYAVAKAGVVHLTRQLASQLGPRGVRVNCLAPATIMTEPVRERISDEQMQMMLRQFPLGRAGEAGDVAEAALFLLSDASAWITGVTLDVAGGFAIV